MVARLLALDLYLNAGEAAPPALPVPTPTGLFATSAAAGASMATTAADAEVAAAGVVPVKAEERGRPVGGAETVPAAVAQSRWTSVEEDEGSHQVRARGGDDVASRCRGVNEARSYAGGEVFLPSFPIVPRIRSCRCPSPSGCCRSRRSSCSRQQPWQLLPLPLLLPPPKAREASSAMMMTKTMMVGEACSGWLPAVLSSGAMPLA